MNTILAAVDEDAFAEHVVAAAGELARATGAKLVVCHVMPERVYQNLRSRERQDVILPSVASAAALDFYFRERAVAERQALVGKLDRGKAVEFAARAAEDAARGLDARRLSYEVKGRVGEPARELVQLAKRLNAGAIVIGFEALRGLGRLRALGSVARAVLERAPCPVFAVPVGAAEPVA